MTSPTPARPGEPAARVEPVARDHRRSPWVTAHQGRRAGFVSRLLAAAVDAGVVYAIYFLVLGFVSMTYALFTREVRLLSTPALGHIAAIEFIALVYLASNWSSTGKTFGSQLLGLRVVTHEGMRLRTRQAVIRAAVAVLVPPGLVWALVSPTNRALHDHVVGSAVVYDWAYRRVG